MHDHAALDILLLVHILFLISVASLAVLIGATVAIVQHIRASHRLKVSSEAPPEPSFSDHLQAAAEYGTLRSPRIVPSQSLHDISARKDWAPPPAAQDAETASSEFRTPGDPSGPHIIRRSSGSTEHHGLAGGDQFHSSAAPRLVVVAGNRIASSKNL